MSMLSISVLLLMIVLVIALYWLERLYNLVAGILPAIEVNQDMISSLDDRVKDIEEKKL